MSDLQCPATLLIARHGDAGYANDGVLSDDGGWLTDVGRAQVGELADTLRSRRISAVYSSRMEPAVESGELAATELGVKAFAVDGLQELSARPEAEDGHAVVSRVRDAVTAIADIHRGERVLVFTHSGVMALVMPRIAASGCNTLAAQRFLPGCVAAEVEVDADGWRVVSWPDSSEEA